MDELIVPLGVGAVLIVLGAMNMKGNISSLHRYHRSRVSEEDRIPFGRKVGFGTIIVGCALILKGCFEYAAESMYSPILNTVGTVVFTAGLVIGFALILLAMMKYNKGIF